MVVRFFKCSTCKLKKPAEDFYKDKSKKTGLNPRCKKCMDISTIHYRNNHRLEYQKYTHKKGIERKGITLEEYDRLFENQKGVCKICGKINKDGRRLEIDHCHKTGKIRGLLCKRCNSAMGYFNDDIQLLKLTVRYLEEQ